jgi:hypothetical protein
MSHSARKHRRERRAKMTGCASHSRVDSIQIEAESAVIESGAAAKTAHGTPSMRAPNAMPPLCAVALMSRRMASATAAARRCLSCRGIRRGRQL